MRSASGASRQGTVSVQRLQMKWETPKLNLYDNIDKEDFLSCLPSDYKACGKPLVIFLSTELPDAAKQLMEVEQGVFGDENVAVGARLFRSVKLRGDRISKDHPYWATLGGKSLPRVIVVDAAGDKTAALDGKEISATNLFKAMKKAAAKTFKTDLEKVVKDTRALLDEMDQIEAKQRVLAEKKKTAKAGEEKQIAAEEEKLALALRDVQERDAELLKKISEDRKVTKA